MPPKLIGYRPMYALRSMTWRQIGHIIRHSTTSTAASWALLFATGLVWSVNALSRSLYRPLPKEFLRTSRATKAMKFLGVSIPRQEHKRNENPFINIQIGIPNQAAGSNASISTWNGTLQTVLSPPTSLLNTSIPPSLRLHEKAAWSLALDLFSKAG